MEASIRWVVVLRLATSAHLESGHGRRGPVVGDREHDGVARPTVRAVGEGIAVSAVVRVVHLRQAVVAGRAVDADGHVRDPVGGALDDAEAVEAPVAGHHGPVDRGDPGERWGSFSEQPTELGHSHLLTFDLDEHSGGVVQHVASEPEGRRVTEHKGTEADALHRPGYPDASALGELTQLAHER